MIEQLEHRKTELMHLREERGATDPILIIAGIAITLILLVGGSFAISGFIANANNLNAKGDLDRIATAQAAFLAEKDRYGALAIGPNVGTQNTQLQESALGFTPTAGNSTIVRTSPSGWTAVTRSATGDIFFRSSSSTATAKLEGQTVPDASAVGPATVARTNLAVTPQGGYKPGTGFGYEASRWGAYGTYTTVTANDGPGIGTARYNRFTINAAGAQSGNRGYGFHLAGNVEGLMTGSFIDVVPVETYTMSTYWRSSYPTAPTFRVRYADSSNWITTAINAPADSSRTGWTRYSYTVTVPANATRMAINFQTVNGDLPVEGGSLDVTGLLMEKSSSLGDFFDGSSSSITPAVSYAWTGASGASTSVQNSHAVTGTQTVWKAQAPTDIPLPSGIAWSQVAADAATVRG